MRRLLDPIAGPRALRAAALAAMCLAAGAHAERARADDAYPKMTLSAYADAAEGRTLLAGRYGAVIQALGDHGVRFKQDDVAASTNLCVAYVMTHRWSEAHPACDEAIRFAKLEAPESPASLADVHGECLAIAYSNRAVLEWLEERPASAADDLARAHALAPESEFVAQNLARLHASLAAAGTHAPLRGGARTAAAAHG